MCRWMHSLRCFWEMGPWLCVCSLPRGNCQQSQERKKKKQESEVCDTLHKHFIWGMFPATESWIGMSDLNSRQLRCFYHNKKQHSFPAFYRPSLSPYFSAACALVCCDSWLMQMQSMFRFLFVSVVFLLYSSQQEQTQTKRFCKY